MSTQVQPGLFSLLPEARPPWKEFVLSLGTQGFALLALAWLAVLRPAMLTPPEHDYHFVQLVNTPPPVPQKPAPVRDFPTPVSVARLNEPIPQNLRLPPVPKPKPQEPELTAPKVQMADNRPAPMDPVKPVIPRQLVRTNVFSTGSSATPTINQPPSKVQTGGFGDPNGLPAQEPHGRAVNIAQLGSFDLPSGPGSGNGTGGAKGVKGVVASSGFGAGVATGDGSGRSNASRGNGVVRQGGFGDAEPVTAASRPKAAPLAAPKMVPVEILSKPTPAYTEEARKMRIEGEVLLEVVFSASGKLQVVRMVRGLGHGLDENAVKAAEQIRFKPALRDGQAADSTATVHIIFQLA